MAEPSDEQARIYYERAEEYDQLISAEDADGRLIEVLSDNVPCAGVRIADVGAGTGRLARLLAPRAQHVHLIDRAAPMLDVARRRLTEDGLAERVSFHVADARRLPLENACVEVSAAGWVFGHFRHWMPDGWRQQVDEALAEMRRVLVSGGHLVVIETLGTGHEEPRQHPALDEYFAHLESRHGFRRVVFRSDYQFADVASAARVCGSFFGEALAARIREQSLRRVPECTGVWLAQRD